MNQKLSSLGALPIRKKLPMAVYILIAMALGIVVGSREAS